jgi:hypothetical protein
MVRKLRRGRLTRLERIESVNRGLRGWGAMFGKPEVAERLCTPLPAKRASKPRLQGVDIDAIHKRPLERNVLKAVTRALRRDPRVARVERNTSGVFLAGNRTISVGVKGKLDLTCYLKSGRYIEIEVKRDERAKPQPHQLERIERIKYAGGLAGWCWSAETALALLP